MKIARLAASSALGIAMTCGLLILMFTLIDTGNVEVDQKEHKKIADIWQEKEEIEENVKQLKPKKPDEPEEPPPEIPRDKMDIQDVADVIQIDMPNLDGKANISIGSFAGDGEYIPLVKIQPEYPRRALERGIEGYVVVEFTITSNGSIVNAKVVEAMDLKGRPTRIFDRAALKAAAKLKYKPRVIDGVPVDVPKVLHKFTFQIEK